MRWFEGKRACRIEATYATLIVGNRAQCWDGESRKLVTLWESGHQSGARKARKSHL